MAAPTYTWEYVCNLFGDEVPRIVTMEASTNLETKIGTALILTGGELDTAEADVTTFFGLAAQKTSAACTAGDPIKVMVIGPGMVIKGTADITAAALSGFSGKLGDFNTDGSMDVGDTAGGCLSVWRTEDAGLTVYCVVSVGACF